MINPSYVLLTGRLERLGNHATTLNHTFIFLAKTDLSDGSFFFEKQQSEQLINQVLRLHSGFLWISPSVAETEGDRHLFSPYFCSFTFAAGRLQSPSKPR